MGTSSTNQTMDAYFHLLDGTGGDTVGGLDEAIGQRVAVRLRYSEARLLCLTSRFTCKTAFFGEPTSGLEPLT